MVAATYELLLLKFHSDDVCVVQIRPAINGTDSGWWRPVPEAKDCLVTLPVVPPGPVSASTIRLLGDVSQEFREDGVVVGISLAWDPPPDPYGEIERYDVYIGQRLLQGIEPSGSTFSTVRPPSLSYLVASYIHSFFHRMAMKLI